MALLAGLAEVSLAMIRETSSVEQSGQQNAVARGLARVVTSARVKTHMAR